MQDLASAADMYCGGPGGSYGHLRTRAQGLCYRIHHAAATAAHHPGMYGLPPGPPIQSPGSLHPGMDSLGHIQDIHAR